MWLHFDSKLVFWETSKDIFLKSKDDGFSNGGYYSILLNQQYVYMQLKKIDK